MRAKLLLFLTLLSFSFFSGNSAWATDFYWVGGGANSNWNNAANWSATPGGAGGFGVPANRINTSPVTLGDNVYFTTGSADCDVNTSINIETIEVAAGYTGVISQGNVSVTFTDLNMSGGSFTGSSFSSRNITVRGNFNQTGGTFTSTKGTLLFSVSYTSHNFSGTFNHNNGTAEFRGTTDISGNPTFYDLKLSASGKRTFDIASIVYVSHDLTLDNSGDILINAGTINLLNTASLTCLNTGDNGGGSGLITFTGTGNQNLVGSTTNDICKLPRLQVNKTSGTVTFYNTVNISNEFANTSNSIDATSQNSKVVFYNGRDGSSGGTINAYNLQGNTTFYDLEFSPSTNTTFTINPFTTFNVAHDFTYSGTNRGILATGEIDIQGDIHDTNTSTSGNTSTTLLKLNGTGSQQIYGSTTEGIGQLPMIEVSKGTSTLTLSDYINLKGGWNFVSGTLNAGTSTVVINASMNLEGAQHTFNILSIPGNSNTTLTANVFLGLQVKDLLLKGSGNINLNTGLSNGQIKISGNLTNSNTSTSGGGSVTLNFNGSTDQTITGNSVVGEGRLPHVTIEKPGGNLYLQNTITLDDGADWTLTSGTLQAGSSTLAVRNSGTVFSGTQTFNNLTFAPSTASSHNYSVNTTSTIIVNGNLTFDGLAGSALSITSGTLEAKKDIIINNGSLSNGGNGLIALTGTGNQNITSSSTADFPSLTISKASGSVSAGNNINVKTTLTMNNGNLNLNGNTLTLGSSASSRGTLSYTAGKVYDGTFSRWYGTSNVAAGNVAGFFPVGSSANDRSIYITTNTSPTTGGLVSVQHNTATAAENASINDNGTTIQSYLPTSWSIATSGLAGGTYALDFSAQGLSPINDLNEIRIVKNGTAVGTHGTAKGTITNASVTRTGISLSELSGTFRIGSTQPITPLPVAFINFQAKKASQSVNLNWQTASEKNNEWFAIQRSADGRNFETIGQVKGAGNSNTVKNYSFTDINPVHGVSYYRLKQIDFDGKFEYSKIVNISFESAIATLAIKLFPNPASNILHVQVNGLNGPAQLEITDITGRTINTLKTTGMETTALNVETLPKGLYQIRIISGNTTTVSKFVKQ